MAHGPKLTCICACLYPLPCIWGCRCSGISCDHQGEPGPRRGKWNTCSCRASELPETLRSEEALGWTYFKAPRKKKRKQNENRITKKFYKPNKNNQKTNKNNNNNNNNNKEEEKLTNTGRLPEFSSVPFNGFAFLLLFFPLLFCCVAHAYSVFLLLFFFFFCFLLRSSCLQQCVCERACVNVRGTIRACLYARAINCFIMDTK